MTTYRYHWLGLIPSRAVRSGVRTPRTRLLWRLLGNWKTAPDLGCPFHDQGLPLSLPLDVHCTCPRPPEKAECVELDGCCLTHSPCFQPGGTV